MSTRVYQLRSGNRLLTHDSVDVPQWLSDLNEVPTKLEVDALIASGDCFITLATVLDHLSESLTFDEPIARPQLEKLTSLLLYLQRHYTVTPKRPDYRQ